MPRKLCNKNKTSVISDPQTRPTVQPVVLPGFENLDVWMQYGEIMITSGHDCGLAEWINSFPQLNYID